MRGGARAHLWPLLALSFLHALAGDIRFGNNEREASEVGTQVSEASAVRRPCARPLLPRPCSYCAATWHAHLKFVHISCSCRCISDLAGSDFVALDRSLDPMQIGLAEASSDLVRAIVPSQVQKAFEAFTSAASVGRESVKDLVIVQPKVAEDEATDGRMDLRSTWER